MRKTIILILATICILTSSVFGVGCGGNVNTDPNTLVVKIYQGGHGTKYIENVIEKFNTLYEGQYKVINAMPSTELVGNTVYKLIDQGTNADVMTGSTVTASEAQGLAGFGECFTDITESVLNQKAIKFDGTEEEETILEKLNKLPIDYDEKKIGDKWYAIPYVNGVGGLAINTKVLNKFTSQLPRTTNELFADAELILAQAAGSKYNPKPFTYATTGNNYCYPAILNWLAQLGGVNYYREFMSFTKDGVDLTLEQCAEQFHDNPILESVMELFVQLYDYNLQTVNVRSQTFENSQAQLMQGKCAFYFVGDWMYNEESVRNAKYLDDITFINTPVASKLGVQTFGSDTKYNFNDNKCEEILCKIIDGVDQNKEFTAIKADADEVAGVQLDESDVQRIVEARGCTQDRSGAGVFINAKSEKKELAALFLRFMCSTECGEMIASDIHCSSPYAMGSLKEHESRWIKSSSSLISNRYNIPLGSQITGNRREIRSLTIFPGMGEIPVVTLTDENINDGHNPKGPVTIYNDTTYEKEKTMQVYVDRAKYFMDINYQDALNCINIKKWVRK